MKRMKRILPIALLAGLIGQAVPSIAAPVPGAGDQPENAGQATAQDQSSSASTSNDQADDSKNAQKLSGVVVTGSHIRRVELETANPVLTVSHEQIMATGDMTLGKLVQDLPSMTGGATNPQYAHSHGGTELSMRGLGASRTLILVDGRRVISSDVGSIPAAMIDHIDVLKNGASAVYGSDAIGGVVNFITRKHYQGAQFSARYGQSSHADARGRGYTFTFGQSTDKGSIIAGVGYNKTDGVPSSARPFTANVLSLEANSQGIPQVYVGGSTNSPYGNIQIPKTGLVHDAFTSCSSGHLARNAGTSGMDPINDYHCYQNSGSNTDKYNYASDTQLLKPQERTNAFVMGNYRPRSPSRPTTTTIRSESSSAGMVITSGRASLAWVCAPNTTKPTSPRSARGSRAT
jgi:outer membrane receptor protein involved in Fe transport